MTFEELEAEALKLDPAARAKLAETITKSLQAISENEKERLWIQEAMRRSRELRESQTHATLAAPPPPSAHKETAKKPSKKSAPKKPAAKKAPVRKARPSKKPSKKKSVSKKATPKKTSPKKTGARKTTRKKSRKPARRKAATRRSGR
jgi:hypothetical protein